MSEASIGMMEGAFFVPKTDILNWINNLLQLNLTKIEQLGTGSAYCQVIDVLFPGTVKLNRVNWKARNEWEFIVNLKTLQQAFQKNNIKKYIEIEKLSKAKYQDNLEFAQWMKRYFDLNNGTAAAKDYDAATKRGTQDTDFSFLEMRDNSRMAAMRNSKNDDSADQKYLRKKMVTRSKSPIIKTLERNQYILGTKSKELKIENMYKKQFFDERDLLLAKFQEIQQILDQNNIQEAQKLKEITEVSNYVKSLNLKMSSEVYENDENNVNQQNKRGSIDRFQHENIIKEEESPLRSEKTNNQQKTGHAVMKNNSQVSNAQNSNSQASNNNNYTVEKNANKKPFRQNEPLTVNNNNNIVQNQNNNVHNEESKSEKNPPQKVNNVQKVQLDKEQQKKQALARVNKHSEALKQKIH